MFLFFEINYFDSISQVFFCVALSNGWLKSVSCLVDIALREYNFVLWYEIIMRKFDMRIKGSRFSRFPWRFHWFDKFKFEVLWYVLFGHWWYTVRFKTCWTAFGPFEHWDGGERSKIPVLEWKNPTNSKIRSKNYKNLHHVIYKWSKRRNFRKNFGRNFRDLLNLSFLALKRRRDLVTSPVTHFCAENCISNRISKIFFVKASKVSTFLPSYHQKFTQKAPRILQPSN